MRTVEEVAAQIGSASVFSVLDAKSLFWQIPLDLDLSNLTMFGTPFGRYKFLRLPFGINLLAKFSNAQWINYLRAIIVDHILVAGRNTAEQDAN